MQSTPNSPDIVLIKVLIRYNLDLPVPSITAINQSVGPNLAACAFVFKLINPYGNVYYEGSFDAPDAVGNWSEITLNAKMMTIAGHLPWEGQWDAIVSVKDTTGTIYNDVIKRVICKPIGNSDRDGNNFGQANISAVVHCDKAKLFVEDKSHYSYGGLQGEIVRSTLKLIYPPDGTNIQPEPFVGDSITHALIPLYFNGDNHQVLMDTVYDYNDNKGSIVRIRYKFSKTFKVNCGADLCDLGCIIKNLSAKLEKGYGTNEERNKFMVILGKAFRAMAGILQPMCGEEVEQLICEIKELAGKDCGCSQNIDGLNRGAMYSNCAAPANLSAAWDNELNQVTINWDRQTGAVDKLTIPELNFVRNNVVPPIALPSNPNVLMNIRVNRLCSDGVSTQANMLFQSVFNNAGLPLLITEHPFTQTKNLGETVTLRVRATGHAPLSYQWYKNGIAISGQTAMDLTLADLAVTDAADYYAVVTDNDGDTAESNPARLSVNKVLVIIEQPTPAAVNIGDSASFFVVASGDDPLTYQWRKANADIAGATGQTLTIDNVQLSDIAQYSVVVRDASGEQVISQYAALQVNQLVTITQQPASQGVNSGQPISLTVRATGDDPLSYQWMKNGVDIPGATQRDYVIPVASAGSAGVYSVRVTDANGDSAVSNGASVSVNTIVIITQQPISQLKQEGESVTFNVVATGDAPLTYQWRKNGVDIPGANGSSYNIPSVGAGDIAAYTVFVQDVNGDTAISAAANLEVNKPVIILVHPQAVVNLTAGDNFTWNVTASGDNPLSYQWFRNGAPIAGATASSYTKNNLQAADNGSYTVRVTDANGDFAVSNASALTVTAIPTTTLGTFYIGFTAELADVSTVQDILNLQHSFSQPISSPSIPADFRPGGPAPVSIPRTLHVAAPITAPMMDFWYAAENNKGVIGEVGGEETWVMRTIGQYHVYSTQYRTMNQDDTIYMSVTPVPAI